MRDFSNDTLDKARENVHGKIAYQCSLPIEAVLPAIDERGVEHARVSLQLLDDPHRSF